MRARSFAAGLAARDSGPVSTDPADFGWTRPSAMIPMPQAEEDPGPRPRHAAYLPDVPVLPETWAPAMASGMPVNGMPA